MSTPASRLADALADRYRIERELGQGGMATVYLARDLRHDRDVAIKVLHPDLAAALGADRFLTEIKTTAKLQHPHILPLLDSGEVRAHASDGTATFLFYVMPFVAGESLRDRLARETQLPVEDALRIAGEVADALGAAHALGIVHRDVKPENILLQGGHALVADFGIALAVQQAGGQRMTQTGLSLGTPQYMSPEQATGERTIDHRSDLYSLGAVTYEMLTGEPPFTGPTVQAIVAKALTERPIPPRSVRDTIPPNVEAAVLRALARLPADRFATATAFVAALEAQATSVMPTPAGPRARVVGLVPWALLVTALALLVPGRFRGTRSDANNVLRATLPLDLREVAPASIVISPDARYLAYLVRTGPQRKLHLMSLATGQETPFQVDEGSVEPFFSPDGRWLLFFSGTSLRRVPVDGGGMEDVAPVRLNSFRAASWTTPDHIVVWDGTLRRLRPHGGRVDTIGTASDTLLRRCIWPISTPDDRHIVCNVGGPLGTEDDILHVVDVATGTIKTTGLDARRPLAFRFDHLIYRRGEGVVMAVPFDTRRGQTSGEPFQLLGETGTFSLSVNGTAVFAETDPRRRLVLRAGDSSRTVWTPPWPVTTPRFSPDGGSIVVRRTDTGGLWLYDISTATTTEIAPAGALPSWSSDGRQIAYVIPTPGMQQRHEVRWRRADLGRPEEVLFRVDTVGVGALHLARDARTVVFHARGQQRDALWTMAIGSNSPPVAFTGPEEQATNPKYSPDGRWLAYTANESGETKVVVRPTSGEGGRITISEPGGRDGVWSPNGRALFYRNDSVYVRADLDLSPTLRVTGRSVVLRGAFTDADGTNYDVAPDGQRLLVPEPVSGGRVVVVVNWIEELRAKLRR